MEHKSQSLRRLPGLASLRGWLRGRIAPVAMRSALARRLLGRAAWRYVYAAPSMPADLGASAGVRISLVMAAGAATPEQLRRTLRSISRQWRAPAEIVVGLGPDAPAGSRTLLAQEQQRAGGTLRLTGAAQPGRVCALNAALAAASGDFVALVAPGDELAADCVHALGAAIAAQDADFLYSDEDEIAGPGRYRNPWFKPDWSPDLLMSLPYAAHVACLRRDLLAQTGLLRPELEGAEIWDLLLRVAERTRRIVHLPQALYHRQPGPREGAGDARAVAAGRQARLDALARRGEPGALEPAPSAPGHLRLRRHVSGEPLVSIIIPSRNNGRVLQACADSIRARSTWRRHELVLLDNGSTEPETLAVFERLAARGATVIRHDAPFNYSGLNNIGARRARGELLLFLNDDTEVITPDWLERLAGYAQAPHVGAVGALLLYPGRPAIQHVGVVNTALGPLHAFLHGDPGRPVPFLRQTLERNWLAVTGACLMVARDRFAQVGGFNEALPVGYNDIDLCMRLYEAGYFNVSLPAVRLLHHESASRGHDAADAARMARLAGEREKLYTLHPQFRGRDPFLNPNLSQTSPWFDLRPRR
ncbi:glycosyltransferase family 2 protein [Camelimonas abortus]|uniref:Glycosyltransferase family 2 protein n=1 Tax=Camelimonas abortus TaxID=1017184 RepID=A0ABV7LAB1_9HYPH